MGLSGTAPNLSDEITLSVDEATGIQAMERIADDLPICPGKPRARELEYKRNGTQILIATINVAMGKVQAICSDTRTEEDFVNFIKQMIEINPGYSTYHFSQTSWTSTSPRAWCVTWLTFTASIRSLE